MRCVCVPFTTIVRLIRKMHRKEIYLPLLISTNNFYVCYGFTAPLFSRLWGWGNKHLMSDIFAIFHRPSQVFTGHEFDCFNEIIWNFFFFFLMLSLLALFFCSLHTFHKPVSCRIFVIFTCVK